MIHAMINLCLVVAAILDKNDQVAAEWRVVWEDNFDGPNIDINKWEFQNGDGCSISNDMCGWGNAELEWYQPQNAFIDNGKLVIEARNEPSGNNRQYSSARLRSKDDWKFGYIEVRAKLAEGKGIWPAIWMLPTSNVYGPWPRSGEIGIMELLGQQPSNVYLVAHFGNAWNQKSEAKTYYQLQNGKFSDDFHTFGLLWSHDSLIWYVDGQAKYSITPSNTQGYQYPFNEQFYLLLNIAVGGNWPGNPDGSTRFPQRMEVDYVKVMKQY